ncbi:MAG: 50S ribosomal protein L25/general stress protein Ctc [Candidatus Omnitrophica bacterium CG11_big_fil_rev_8_21_14_0_20_45_26]|uniref:Large ribosomal subunit protein bL25 n=1 Tax=Candidatus Abzuiibacterium crystallinum TaxID=1974748 RepID=A0A2H0LSI8_9BACT|nr:MAG: 50S ribosomal protein L25/general stress protein Ctc [Candidatus Omnitrophica bacterium CG11_big_fil_rev_8_21_14_0_20_45_26]PIW63408.1 MAG: 50S ribosomal protein L25 [Candidatus Omnitrophica bacterium CG12_big_fil_rev_8_21_14_0_65_45_16]
MKTVELKAAYREKVGKASAKRVRAQKQIPAVVYGHKTKPISVTVDYKDFLHVIHTGAGENVVIDLKVQGPKQLAENVIIKDMQYHPVTDLINHIDFTVISMTEKIEIKVRLAIKGESPGAKEGGVLDVVHHEIDVECLPTQIPDKIDCDISALNIGDAIHASELKIPAGVKCLFPEDEVIVTVHAPKAEESEPAAEEAPSEPEVIAKGKEAKEGEGEEGEKAPAPEAKKEDKKEKKE